MRRPQTVLILLTAAWQLACLLMMRAAWIDTPGYSSGLAAQMTAAIPLAIWLLWLARGRLEEFDRQSWILLIAMAAILRLPLLWVDPSQSDDLYRYIWEGRIQWEGFNPYILAPNAPELAHLRDAVWMKINHPDVAAIYPPLALWVFSAVEALGRVISAPLPTVKLVFAALDWLTLIALGSWLTQAGRSRAWAALWAFHPLAIIEFSGNGHLDSLMVLLTVWALLSFERGKLPGSLIALTGAILAKLIPVLLLPFYLFRLGRRWWWLGMPPVLIVLAYLPYGLGSPARLFEATETYLVNWTGNAPAFELIRWLCKSNGYTARWVFWGGLCALAAWFWFRRRSPLETALPLIGYYLAVGPMVHPWYLTLALPMAIMAGARERGIRFTGPWIWLTVAAPLDYLRYTLDPYPWWIAAIIWAPFWLGMGLGKFRGPAKLKEG